MDAVELVVLVCTSCKLTFALQAEWLKELDEDEMPTCCYCGSDAVGTLISSEVS